MKLKGSNNDGVWNELGTSIQVTVTRPFWETTWFYSSMIMLSLCIGVAVVYYVGKLRNEINERKLVEKDREELITLLETQNTELERFAYTISHDLKSPLVTIKGYVGALNEDLNNGANTLVQEDLGYISSAADTMADLLHDILELSRIGRQVNPPQTIDMSDLVDDALRLVHGQIEQTKVQVDVMPDMPIVYGDRTRLLEVIQNLVDNAAKYMGDESHPLITIGAYTNEKETVCSVRDNGIGISPDFQEKIFGLFDQLDPKAEGSGVGLAIVKRIVELHNGRIWVQSIGSDQGSTFYFTIPNQNSV